jgi:hypothetical protein
MTSSVDLRRRLLAERANRLAALDVAIARGRSDVEARRIEPAEKVFARLDAKYRKMAKTGTARPARRTGLPSIDPSR